MAILCSVCVCRGTLGSVQSEMCSSVRMALWRYVAIRGAMWRYVVLCGDTGGGRGIWRDVSAAVTHVKNGDMALRRANVAPRRATSRYVAMGCAVCPLRVYHPSARGLYRWGTMVWTDARMRCRWYRETRERRRVRLNESTAYAQDVTYTFIFRPKPGL